MTGNVATIADLEPIMGNIIKYSLFLAGIVLFVLILIGGFKYITSGGDPKAVEAAQKTLTYAIGGLFLLLLSYLFLVFIRMVTGVDVTQFQVV